MQDLNYKRMIVAARHLIIEYPRERSVTLFCNTDKITVLVS